MSARTGIAWCTSTWNPWLGCTKVSPGCAHCYAERQHLQYKLPPFDIVRRSKTTFTDPLRWKDAQMVFTCSWSDWFHEAADEWRDEAWEIIRRTPHHTYQILTKRPERILDHLPSGWGNGWPNVWLGVSVENQRHSGRAWELVQSVAAPVLFLSCEPLLGPLDLTKCRVDDDTTCNVLPGISWVIVGGESGPDHRPMREEWARSLRAQCREWNIPYFLKQLGGWPDARAHDKALLDGRTWTEMPEPTAVSQPDLFASTPDEGGAV